MSIPNNINVEHVVKAIEDIEKNGVPDKRLSTKYAIMYYGKHYPPKYVLSLANSHANGAELEPTDFSGGEEANGFLKRLGFTIVDETSDEIFSEVNDAAVKHFHRTVVDAYRAAKKECGYNASLFIQLITERGAMRVAKEFLAKNNATTGFEKLWEKGRLDLTIEELKAMIQNNKAAIHL